MENNASSSLIGLIDNSFSDVDNDEYDENLALFNSSMSTAFVPNNNAYIVQDDVIEIDDEIEDVAVPIQVPISDKTATIKRRGRPPLSEEEKKGVLPKRR